MIYTTRIKIPPINGDRLQVETDRDFVIDRHIKAQSLCTILALVRFFRRRGVMVYPFI